MSKRVPANEVASNYLAYAIAVMIPSQLDHSFDKVYL